MRVGVLSVLLATWVPSVFGVTIEIHPQPPRINQTVTFMVHNVIGKLQYFEWFKGEGTASDSQIILMNSNGIKINGQQYFPEADVLPNGSLVIKGAQKRHEGYYTVSVVADKLEQATVRLSFDDSTGGLSGGAIAGIVIAVLVVAAIVIAGVVYLFKAKSSKTATTQPGVI
ncbi:carcinoembryonic antigen-related cell adhesion molecule 3-like isoform X1 [Eleutherodactylus coqui]|uniref:carcinoembryonic antigen-related cell adhesion molecule 3-like isoform X1 n=1 Tax=Eleutherodactylus coqui TaxID=57060 RepID=UPI003461F598